MAERKTAKHIMSEQDKIEWDELYEYIKTKVMEYDENQKLNSHIVLRLRGLSLGIYMANNSIQDEAKYPYKIILMTFKACNPQIVNAKRTVKFNDNNHKFNYFAKIVGDKLDDIYDRYKRAEQTKNSIEKIDIPTDTHKGANFNKNKRHNKLVNDLEDIW